MSTTTQRQIQGQSEPAIGLVDWGIGGLSVYRQIRLHRPSVPMIYLSDTGSTAYGRMGRDELRRRMERVAQWFAGRGVRRFVVACNAASTVLAEMDRTAIDGAGLAITGMIEPTVRGVLRLTPVRLGVIGGARTIRSGAYRRAFAAQGIAVDQRIAQPLSALIERGDTSSAQLQDECRRVVAPLAACTHLLLACTHYPAIAPVLQSLMPGTILIDPASFVAKALPRPNAGGVAREAGAADEFHTTGDRAMMKRAALAAFAVAIDMPQRARL